MTPEQLVDYYVGLLIMEYFGLPKASGMISAVVSQAVASMIVLQVRSGFSLSSASGKQLDCIGQLIGAQRAVPGFVPGVEKFAMPGYPDPDAGDYIGFARYDDNPVPNGHWARYNDIDTAYIMADGIFAQFIRFLVAVRASDYSLEAIDDICFAFFGTLVVITDNLNMSMTYTHDETNDPGVLFAILKYLRLLPRPAGVSYTVIEV
jgi:hypothetical protein